MSMSKKMIISLLLAVMLCAGGLGLAQLDMTGRLYDSLVARIPFPWSGTSTPRLKNYRVLRDGIEINGIQKDLSGITYNWDTDSLFAVVDETPEIFELNRQGVMRRKIKIVGLEDLEGICYLGQGRFAVVEERRMNIVFLKIDPGTLTLERADLKMIHPVPGEYDNQGFEGIAADVEKEILFVAKEHSPRKIIRISGIALETFSSVNTRVTNLWETEPKDLGLRDFAGLHFDAETDHLFILSDESRLIMEMTLRGIKVGTLELEKGSAALSADIPKPEGITMDRKGTIFIVSEPNLFYVFEVFP